MKRKMLLIVIINIVIMFLMTGCLKVKTDFEDEGNWKYGLQKFPKKCFVAQYNWDGDRENMTIEIPESYNGIDITTLGGYSGSVRVQFGIYLPVSMWDEQTYPSEDGWSFYSTESEELVENEDYETLQFHIILGDNITQIEGPIKTVDYYGKSRFVSKQDVEEHIQYKIEYYYECSEDNPAFYSEDGVLYEK